MKKYEYTALYISKKLSRGDLHSHLNDLGKEGWELVSVVDFSNVGLSHIFFEADETTGFIFFFKRELA